MNFKNIKSILPIEGDSEYKLAYLNQNYKTEGYASLIVDEFPAEVKEMIESLAIQVQKREVKIGFEQMKISKTSSLQDQIIAKLVPQDVGIIPSGFETVGSIAHLNLRDCQLPYKHIIGEVILKKTPNIKTVVNKIDKISHQFRFYEMEVLAGQNNFITQVVEDGVRLQLDLSKVYWCSKLHSERQRMLQFVKKGDIICDMFCGIGPFAIKAAKKKQCKVLANDLNPACFEYLNKNIKKNKLIGKVFPFRGDARRFVKYLINLAKMPSLQESKIPEENKLKEPKQEKLSEVQILEQQSKQEVKEKQENAPKEDIFEAPPSSLLHFDHVYMNLPADALQFLDVFSGLFKEADPSIWSATNLPMIHVYGFSNGETLEEAKKEMVERINSAFGISEGVKVEDIKKFHRIRDISTTQRMYSISFKLPASVAFGEKEKKGSAIGIH